jgi:hypothetical protein
MTVTSSAAVLFFKKYIQRFDRHLTVPIPVHARRRTGINFGIEQHYLVAIPVTALCFKKNESYDVVTGTGHMNRRLVFLKKTKK